MTGLATAPAETRKRAGWGTVTKLAANRTRRRLTRVPNTTLAAFHSNKARNILSKQNLNQPVSITQGWKVIEITVVNGQDLPIS